jgi:hypothetical protein
MLQRFSYLCTKNVKQNWITYLVSWVLLKIASISMCHHSLERIGNGHRSCVLDRNITGQTMQLQTSNTLWITTRNRISDLDTSLTDLILLVKVLLPILYLLKYKFKTNFPNYPPPQNRNQLKAKPPLTNGSDIGRREMRTISSPLPSSQETILSRMPSSGMLRRVALVRTDDSEELSASFIRVTRIGELGTTLAAISNRCMWYFFQGGAKFLRNVGSYKSHTG